MTWQAWRSLVTPWIVWHRRPSSWCLWGSHILLLCMLHICSLSHCECNYMHNQLWSDHTHSTNLLFSYIPLFFIIFIIFYHYHYYSQFAVKGGTHSVMTLLWCSEVYFHLFHPIFLCCVVSFLWGPQTVWFVILHLECSTQNIGGMCNLVIFGSPRVTYCTGKTFGFNVNISYLYSVKPQIIVL